jgi:predicted methyltransferase MtxX (methanogen marker protein 4)
MDGQMSEKERVALLSEVRLSRIDRDREIDRAFQAHLARIEQIKTKYNWKPYKREENR